MPDRRKAAKALVVIGLCVLSFVLGLRAVRLVKRFTTAGLQMDFAAYYAAGQALNRGLSPYDNHIVVGIWDGCARYPHSRFLYPPAAASLFQPLALLPYPVAKTIWTILSLLCVVASMVLLARMLHLRGLVRFLAATVATLGFHPLYTTLERGQTDGLTLLLLTLSLWLKVERASPLAAGMLLAGAVVLKPPLLLFAILLVPLALVERDVRLPLGLGLGCIAVVAGALVLHGPALTRAYVRQHALRMAIHGEGGDPARRLDPRLLRQRGDPILRSLAGKGRPLLRERVLAFDYNASSVPYLLSWLRRAGVRVRAARVSLALLACVWLLLAWRTRRLRGRPRAHPACAFAFWSLALALVLTMGPLSWTMSVVWLLPAVTLLLAHDWRTPSSRDGRLWLALVGFGYLLLAMPDRQALGIQSAQWLGAKYALGEILMAVGLYAYWERCCARLSTHSDPEPAEQGGAC